MAKLSIIIRAALFGSMMISRVPAQDSAAPVEPVKHRYCNPPCAVNQECRDGMCVGQAPISSEDADREEPQRNLREERKHNVVLETPWNGLVGIGILYMYRPVWPLAVEGGVGVSTTRLKYGLRGRYCFLKKNASPFVGMGFMRTAGAKNTERLAEGVDVAFDLDPINFIQVLGGLDLVIDFGLTFIIGTGWAFPLNTGVKNITYEGMSERVYRTSGSFRQRAFDTFQSDCKLLYEGGPVISAGIAGSFR